MEFVVFGCVGLRFRQQTLKSRCLSTAFFFSALGKLLVGALYALLSDSFKSADGLCGNC